MGRGAGAPRTGGTPKSYHSRHPAQAHLRTCFQTRERLPQPRFFLAARPPVHRHSERSLRSEVRFCIARLLCDASLFDPPHAGNSLSSRPESPRFCRACIHCHPDRSDPIFSSAPQCGASGRAVEGSRHNLTVEQSLPIVLSAFSFACGLSTVNCQMAALLCDLCVLCELCVKLSLTPPISPQKTAPVSPK